MPVSPASAARVAPPASTEQCALTQQVNAEDRGNSAVGVILTSFRTEDAAKSSGWWTLITNFSSYGWTGSNYSDAWTNADLGPAFLNSLAIALPATFVPILIAAFAAYAFTFMQFKFRDTLFIISDDRERIRQRVIRIMDPNCHAESPKSRLSRIIGNVRVVSADAVLTEKGDGFIITYTIDEGPRYKIADVAVNVNVVWTVAFSSTVIVVFCVPNFSCQATISYSPAGKPLMLKLPSSPAWGPAPLSRARPATRGLCPC